MADMTDSRAKLGAVYPVDAIESPEDHLEPVLDAEALVAEFLFGIPLVSALPDPMTGKVQRMTPALVKRFIDRAIQEIEELSHTSIMPAQFDERHDFDKQAFQSFGFFRLRHRPIASVELLSIQGSDGTNFFHIPAGWLEVGLASMGQINILPLSPANSTFTYASIAAGGPAALIFMTYLTGMGHIPAYWTCRYTAGYPEGKVPRYVNTLIGCQAAMNILSNLQATWAMTSQSLGIDGLSQSTSNPGPQVFKVKIDDLKERRDQLIGKLRGKTGQRMVVGAL
jgi:hypothetical protein